MTTADERAEAVALLRAKRATAEELAEALGVAAGTVRNWQRKAELAEAREARKAAALEGAKARAEQNERAREAREAEPPEAPADPLEAVRAMIASAQADADRARQIGDYKGVQHSTRTAAGLMPVLARLEKLQAEGGDTLTLSRADIKSAFAEIDALFASLAARPLLCANCHRELSIAWGEGKEGL